MFIGFLRNVSKVSLVLEFTTPFLSGLKVCRRPVRIASAMPLTFSGGVNPRSNRSERGRPSF